VRLRAFSIYGLPETIPIDKAANSRLVHIKKRQPVLQGLQSKAAQDKAQSILFAMRSSAKRRLHIGQRVPGKFGKKLWVFVRGARKGAQATAPAIPDISALPAQSVF
jgi:hypothetical protein